MSDTVLLDVAAQDLKGLLAELAIDASVFVAAARPAEPLYLSSRAFIPEAQQTKPNQPK